MLYEKKIASLPQLFEELKILDPDAGIRADGSYRGKRCLIFATRSFMGFTVMLYSVKTAAGIGIPDRQLFAKEYENEEELVDFLKGVVATPVRGFSY